MAARAQSICAWRVKTVADTLLEVSEQNDVHSLPKEQEKKQ